jgi:hypothetical protein
MSEDIKGKVPETLVGSRRQFVKTAGQVAVTAPAVAMLLNATTKSAMAQVINPYQASSLHILDDFTFGNNEEDIDALRTGTNFNGLNGQANQDDTYIPPPA